MIKTEMRWLLLVVINICWKTKFKNKNYIYVKTHKFPPNKGNIRKEFEVTDHLPVRDQQICSSLLGYDNLDNNIFASVFSSLFLKFSMDEDHFIYFHSKKLYMEILSL